MRSRIKGCSLANVESTGLVILPQEKLYSRFLCKADCLPDSCLSRKGLWLAGHSWASLNLQFLLFPALLTIV